MREELHKLCAFDRFDIYMKTLTVRPFINSLEKAGINFQKKRFQSGIYFLGCVYLEGRDSRILLLM